MPGVTAPRPQARARNRPPALPVLTFVIIHALPIETIDVSARSARFDSAVLGRSPAHERGVFVVRTQLLRLILMTCLAHGRGRRTFGRWSRLAVMPRISHWTRRRGLLYVANFTANRIEVISTSDYARQSPYRVPPQPGSIALSPDGRYLVIARYARWTDPAEFEPAVTILDLDTAGQRTLSMTTSPLAVAFGGGNQALVVSETGFQLLDPVTGAFQELRPSAMAGKDLPVPFATSPAPDHSSFGGGFW